MGFDRQRIIEIRKKFVASFLGSLGDSEKALGKPGFQEILVVRDDVFKIYYSEEINTKKLIAYYYDFLGNYYAGLTVQRQKLKSEMLCIGSTIQKLQMELQKEIAKRQRDMMLLCNLLNSTLEFLKVSSIQCEMENLKDEIACVVQGENQRISNLQMQYWEKQAVFDEIEYILRTNMRIIGVKKSDNSNGYCAYYVKVGEKEPGTT